MPDALKQTISATEVSALFDASPYQTRWMLYRKFANGEEVPGLEHNRMRFGKKMQGIILAEAVEDLHMEIRPNVDDNYIRRLLSGCTRDAEIICPDRGPGAIEAKMVFDYGIWMDPSKWNGGKAVPREIEWQLQQQMYVGDGVTPFAWGKIAAFVCGQMEYFERKPVPELFDMIEKRTAEFFDDVKNGREPDPMGAAVEIPSLVEFFPVVKGQEPLDLREVTYEEGEGMGQITAEGKRRVDAMEQARLLDWHGTERLGHERAEKDIKAKMLALAGDRETVLLPEGVKINIKQISRRGYEVAPTTYKTVDVYVPGGA